MFFYSVSPSSGFQPASPLNGEAVKRVRLAQETASPLRGEAECSSDEGGIEINPARACPLTLIFDNFLQRILQICLPKLPVLIFSQNQSRI